MPAPVAPAPDDGDNNSDGQAAPPAPGGAGPSTEDGGAMAVQSDFPEEDEGEEMKPLIRPRKMTTKQLCLELDVRLHEAMGAFAWRKLA